jgi:CubicO group peptidase (beta-lactamase class C family)
MKVLKKIGKWLLVILILLNIAILVSGRTYIYKAIANTYLKGRGGPSIDEYEIFAKREVPAGNPMPWKVSPSLNAEKISEDHQKQFDEMETVAFLVVKEDQIIHEQYWDGYGADSYTNSFSMAKTFVSMLVGVALQEGKIQSLDQPVGDFIPEYKVGKRASITIRHLLTMSSGIDFDENYASPLAYPAAAYYGSDLNELTMSYDVAENPGKTFRYLSGNTELLAFVLEKATGMKLSQYMSEKIWKPVGAEKPAYWSLDNDNGVEKAYCCFNSNARDFARLGKLYLDTGQWNGQQVIPADYVLKSVEVADLQDPEGKQIDNYGFSWWLLPDYKGHRIFYARGILGQYIICIPDQKMVVVRLGRKREKRKGNDHPLDLFYYIDAALEMYAKK